MHAAAPWLVTWDDHEFENNYAGSISERKDAVVEDFLKQRARRVSGLLRTHAPAPQFLAQGGRHDPLSDEQIWPTRRVPGP